MSEFGPQPGNPDSATATLNRPDDHEGDPDATIDTELDRDDPLYGETGEPPAAETEPDHAAMLLDQLANHPELSGISANDAIHFRLAPTTDSGSEIWSGTLDVEDDGQTQSYDLDLNAILGHNLELQSDVLSLQPGDEPIVRTSKITRDDGSEVTTASAYLRTHDGLIVMTGETPPIAPEELTENPDETPIAEGDGGYSDAYDGDGGDWGGGGEDTAPAWQPNALDIHDGATATVDKAETHTTKPAAPTIRRNPDSPVRTASADQPEAAAVAKPPRTEAPTVTSATAETASPVLDGGIAAPSMPTLKSVAHPSRRNDVWAPNAEPRVRPYEYWQPSSQTVDKPATPTTTLVDKPAPTPISGHESQPHSTRSPETPRPTEPTPRGGLSANPDAGHDSGDHSAHFATPSPEIKHSEAPVIVADRTKREHQPAIASPDQPPQALIKAEPTPAALEPAHVTTESGITVTEFGPTEPEVAATAERPEPSAITTPEAAVQPTVADTANDSAKVPDGPVIAINEPAVANIEPTTNAHEPAPEPIIITIDAAPSAVIAQREAAADTAASSAVTTPEAHSVGTESSDTDIDTAPLMAEPINVVEPAAPVVATLTEPQPPLNLQAEPSTPVFERAPIEQPAPTTKTTVRAQTQSEWLEAFTPQASPSETQGHERATTPRRASATESFGPVQAVPVIPANQTATDDDSGDLIISFETDSTRRQTGRTRRTEQAAA